MSTTGSTNINLEELKAALKGQHYAMFSTITDDGAIIARPMASHGISNDGLIWFFTKKDTAKVHNIEHDSHVNLAYAEPAKEKFISICGKAVLDDNKEKARELWHPMLTAWFPEGVDDPTLLMIGVSFTSAEVWDTPTNVLEESFGAVKAAFTGETFEKGFHTKHYDGRAA